MRTATPAELALLGAGESHYEWFAKVEVQNNDGVWVDLTSFCVGFRWGESIDDAQESGSITFIREDDTDGVRKSLAPLWIGSPLNADSGGYAAILNPFNPLRIFEGINVVGADDPLVMREVLRGLIDNPSWGGDITEKPGDVTVSFRGLGGILADTQIEEIRAYPQQTLGQLIQALLDSNGHADIALYQPEPVLWELAAYKQPMGSLLDAIWQKAMAIGHVARYRWWPDDIYRFSLYNPIRDTLIPDLTIEESQILNVSQIELNGTGVRNYVRLWYADEASGLSMAVDVWDEGSILIFGRRFMQLGEDSTQGISNETEALDMANYAISDLSIPLADMVVTLNPDHRPQLGDVVQFSPLTPYFDEVQTWGIVRVEHERGLNEEEQKTGRTYVSVRGKPAGTYQRWIRMAGSFAGVRFNLPSPKIGPLWGESSPDADSTNDGGVWLDFEFDARTVELHVYTEVAEESPVPNPAINDDNARAAIISRPEGAIGLEERWKSKFFSATPPDWFKKMYVYGVGIDGKKGLPKILEVQAKDAISCNLVGADDLTVTRVGDANILNWTAPAQDSPSPVVWIIRRNGANLTEVDHVEGPMEFEDAGLQMEADYDYEVLPWSHGISGGSAVADTPAEPPPDDPVAPRPYFTGGTPKIEKASWGDVLLMTAAYRCDDPDCEFIQLEQYTGGRWKASGGGGPWSWFATNQRSPGMDPFVGSFQTQATNISNQWRLVARNAAMEVLSYSDIGYVDYGEYDL